MTAGVAAVLVLLLAIIVYLALIADLFFYVERHHRQTWRDLGEPWPWNATPSNIWRSTKFVFFGGIFVLWHDPNVRRRAVAVWISFAVAFVTLVIAKSY